MPKVYTVSDVVDVVDRWESQYGPMVTYRVMLDGVEGGVALNQKPETAAPEIGDELYGDIQSSKYGNRFKKEQRPPEQRPPEGFSGGGSPKTKAPADTFTMYLSYAKDIAVALLQDGKLDADAYMKTLEYVKVGGYTLYNGRPDAPKNEETGREEDVVWPVEDM